MRLTCKPIKGDWTTYSIKGLVCVLVSKLKKAEQPEYTGGLELEMADIAIELEKRGYTPFANPNKGNNQYKPSKRLRDFWSAFTEEDKQ